MRSVFAIMVSLICLQAIAAGEPRQEIRFCPGDVARTYPLDSRGRVQSLLVPHVAVINHAATAFTVSAIHLELQGGQVVDARHLDAADIQRFASNGPDIQEVFCGTDLIAPGIKLAGLDTEIRAAAGGKVIESANDVPEDQSLLQLPNESTDAYTARVRETQARLMRTENGLMGNHVIIDHGHREYSVYAHMQPGSVLVRPGDNIAAGALLGRLARRAIRPSRICTFTCTAGRARSNAMECL